MHAFLAHDGRDDRQRILKRNIKPKRVKRSGVRNDIEGPDYLAIYYEWRLCCHQAATSLKIRFAHSRFDIDPQAADEPLLVRYV